MTLTSTFLPYGQQWLTDEDVQEVINVLKTDWLTQGPKVAEFEARMQAYTGARYAVAVANGTAALHLACLAAGLGEGDEVITSPNTFVASANCALYCGARPAFVDIDSRTYNLSPESLQAYLRDGASNKARPRAVIPVHFAGHPCDMESIAAVARQHGLIVIEDAAHAVGATWRTQENSWQHVGSCSHSDMTTFSFHPVKQMTTGEGGMILTNREDLYRKLLLLRTHGITKNSDDFTDQELAYEDQLNPWYYEMQALGFNYRITDFQCALGIKQLEKLDGFVRRRREIVSQYNAAFAGCQNLVTPYEDDEVRSSYHLYVLQIDFKALGKSRAQVMQELRQRGIGSQVLYIPVPYQPYYRKQFGYQRGAYPVAEAYYERTLSLPLYPKMQDHDVRTVIRGVLETLAK